MLRVILPSLCAREAPASEFWEWPDWVVMRAEYVGALRLGVSTFAYNLIGIL